MLWRVRATLPDQPGTLAVLAQNFGDSGVNILGLQIFPGVDTVTDELILRTPSGWSEADLARLVERSGGTGASAVRCTENALVDQPTRYVRAARAIAGHPASFPDVVAKLFDAEADRGPDGVEQDVMELTVGDVDVQIRRAAPFTPTEIARGAALADLVADQMDRMRGKPVVTAPVRVSGDAQLSTTINGVEATLDGVTVGWARLRLSEEPGVLELSLRVDPAWQRHGVGRRLLREAARVAVTRQATEIVMTTSTDNEAVLPMVLAAGLRGRIRMASETLTVRVPLRDLKPVPA
ncbi:GNAT family N-acetyltransferase [Nocardioides jiangxiensis]|uniref:GNAT family N-acetyltransferase n=1 Tax=Nocardioides jiangxiensis TaxID=3064524 RepID=A0ABT9AZ21_9ACTN|nr:GNAT family N-acetyltransferase [Nocardioides sp. WY-20]MDO7867608.1 GNAT family N-acetyltransferase [Nocardioides sp. WY-20]